MKVHCMKYTARLAEKQKKIAKEFVEIVGSIVGSSWCT
jgi:hypothetical protein